ncbi:MAG: hypothetical protein K8R59_03445 [Thermoanaerobaculales bacterium]|nr:hypothetical protein [Thermoanaerobaculales bacterium]
MSAVKIATSVPAEQFQALEETRKRLGLKRSTAVQDALALWLVAKESGESIATYLRGYLDQPEDAGEAAGFVATWVDGLDGEEW